MAWDVCSDVHSCETGSHRSGPRWLDLARRLAWWRLGQSLPDTLGVCGHDIQ